MTPWTLTPRVEADIDHIWDYSADRWGIDQAERYIRNIRVAIEGVAADPSLAQPAKDVRDGYARVKAGSHIIFFRQDEGSILIVRILHERMDLRDRLHDLD